MRILLLLVFVGVSAFAKAPQTTTVAIVGAGLSGLATARLLKKEKIPYHILEIAPRVGGRVRTVRYERDGEVLLADSGMEEYWESNPAVEVLKELNLPLRIDVAVSSLVLQGKLFEMLEDDGAAFLKKVLSKDERAALERFKKHVLAEAKKPTKQLLATLKDTTFADWVKKQNLPAKTLEWIRVSVECEIGTGWDRIAALDGIHEFHIFAGEGEKAARVLGGNDQFTEAFADSVGRGNISLNHRVHAVRTKDDGVEVAYMDLETNTSGSIKAEHVVTTIPLYRLFEVQFDPPLSPKKRQAIDTMSWGAYFKAHVFVPAATERFWKKADSSVLPILSDSALGVIYDGTPEAKGKTRILSLLITGDFAERFNMTPLEKVREELKAAFDKLWPGMSKEITGIEFYRFHPRAIAAWPPGRSRFDDLSEEIRTPDGHVHLAGDFTETSHSDGAFRSAERAVRQILSERSALSTKKKDPKDAE